MKPSVFLVPLIFFLLHLTCRLSKQQDCTLKTMMDNLISSRIDSNYKRIQDELKCKADLIEALCDGYGNKKKIIIIDNPIRGTEEFYGLIYVFDNDLTLTYQQDEDNVILVKGNKFDKYGKNERFLSMIKDSTLIKLEEFNNNKRIYPDAFHTNVIFLDSEKLFSKHFILW